MAEGNGGQGYTFKEMFAMYQAQLNTRLDKIELKLDGVATAHDLREIEARVAAMEAENVKRQSFYDNFGRVEKNVNDLVAVAVNPEKVKSIVNEVVEERKGQRWTTREKQIAILVGVITIFNTLLNFASLGPDVLTPK